MRDTEKFVTQAEAARLLGMPQSTISRWVTRGRIATVEGEMGRFGRPLKFIPREALEPHLRGEVPPHSWGRPAKYPRPDATPRVAARKDRRPRAPLPPEFVTYAEAARILGVSQTRVRELCNAGRMARELVPTPTGGPIRRLRRDSFQAFLASRGSS